MSDDRWGALQELAHRVVHGHYPWCNDHAYPKPMPHETAADVVDWCQRREEGGAIGVGGAPMVVATMWAGAGSYDGSPHVDFELREDVNLDQLTLEQADVLASTLARLVRLATRYAGVASTADD